MRRIVVLLLACASLSAAGEFDWKNLPANTWVPVKPVTVQPGDPDERGRWQNVSWNRMIYDAANKRVLFNDRWLDRKHGGNTIYGNCVFSFEPATRKLTPLRLTNWVRRRGGPYGYKTVALPENTDEPTPCDRHVYNAFTYVPELDAVFIANGANRGAEHEGMKGHGICRDTWRLDLAAKKWSKIDSKEHPANKLEHGMAWCPDTKAIVYAGHKTIWILDVEAGQWRKAKEQLPEVHMGISVRYDAPRKRMLLVGGGTYGKSRKKDGGYNRLYAFDPKTEKLSRLADCPTALVRAHLAHDTRRDLFLYAVKMKEGSENPSGMFSYDPKANAWAEVRAKNELPLGKRRGPMPLCYDAEHDCFIGFVPYNPDFYAFRFVPEGNGPAEAKGGRASSGISVRAREPSDIAKGETIPSVKGLMKVFLLAGQSNMVGQGTTAKLPAELRKSPQNVLMFHEGKWGPLKFGDRFGPEVGFAHAMAKAWPKTQIGIIKVAKGGTSLVGQWNPGREGGLYVQVTNAVKQARRGTNIEVAGVLWAQWNADAGNERNAGGYEKRFKAFIMSVRKDLRNPRLIFLSALPESEPTPRMAKQFKYGAIVRDAQLAVHEALESTALIVPEGLTMRKDGIHYDTEGQLELGRRFAEAYLKLLGEKDATAEAGGEENKDD